MKSVKSSGIVFVCLIALMCFVTSCFGIPFNAPTTKDTSKETPKPPPTESKAIEPESPAMPEVDIDHAQDDVSLSETYAVYYQLLTAAINEFGTGAMLTNADGSPQIKGVIYAELIDFDNDGLPELLLMYGDDDFFASAYCVIYTYLPGYVKLLESYHLYLNHSMISIAESRSGVAYLCYSEGDYSAWSDSYFTLVDTDWTEVLSLVYFIVDEIYDDDWNWLEDVILHYIDGVEVSEHEFENALERYLGIINIREINIFDENYETVNNVLTTLEALT